MQSESTNGCGPLVSVVMPLYNMACYVEDALRSVLASDYPALEVVVVDDGSTDDSANVVKRVAQADSRVRLDMQPNGGACRARNRAVQLAHGTYILPVDADNRIEPHFISAAVAMMEADSTLKAVQPRADFFGDRTGEWRLPPFSLHLLARKNIMDTCALYRRADWQRVGGYCEEIVAREDWEFWIAVLKDGGRVERAPQVAMHYRVRAGSKRVSDRQLKRHVVSVLNRRHPEFFERELGGPLRYRRTWSRAANAIWRTLCPRRMAVDTGSGVAGCEVKALPVRFAADAGVVIHSGRNELRRLPLGGREMVVKQFCVPNVVNRIAYGLLRPSKAQRSFEYARLLLSKGIGTPRPVAWMTLRHGLLLAHSYYVSELSACPYTYAHLLAGKVPAADVADYLRAIARTTARLHNEGMVHKDYSRGNILFGPTPRHDVELIDLNRLRFRREVTMEEGCRNFAERLPATPQWREIMAQEYAAARGFDAAECLRLMNLYNVEKS